MTLFKKIRNRIKNGLRNGNQEQWKRKSYAGAVISSTENTKTVSNKEVNWYYNNKYMEK